MFGTIDWQQGMGWNHDQRTVTSLALLRSLYTMDAVNDGQLSPKRQIDRLCKRRDSMHRTLPDPDAAPGTDVVIYDGQCHFCQGQVRNLQRLDPRGKRLSFLSLHDPRVSQRYPDLSHDDLMAQMYVVDTKGQRYGGSDAVRYLTRRLPLLWPAMPLLHLPGTAGLWRWAYNEVAKRRYRISGRTCDQDACSIHLNR